MGQRMEEGLEMSRFPVEDEVQGASWAPDKSLGPNSETWHEILHIWEQQNIFKWKNTTLILAASSRTTQVMPVASEYKKLDYRWQTARRV